MSLNITISLDGLSDAISRLAALNGNAYLALQRGLLKGGKIVQADAKTRCPVDTGRLRGSITVEAQDGNSVRVGTNVEYAIYVEFGTGSRGDKSVAHTTKAGWVYYDTRRSQFVYTKGQAAQPYLVPALEAQKDAVIQAIKDGLLEAF